MRSRFRCASVRGFRAEDCERFVAITKYLQPETLSGSLIYTETISDLPDSRPLVNKGCGSAGVKTGRYMEKRVCASSSLVLQVSSAPQSFRSSFKRAITC
jgi:hypothetical protein